MAKAERAIDTKDLKGDDKILAEADGRLRFCVDGMDRLHREGLEDLMFFDGQQWPEDILRQRNDDRRPSETINKLPTFANQVINDMRQNRPQSKIRPVDNVTDPDTAEVLNGLVRSIMNNGDSKNAVDTASFYQVVNGFGYARILTKYADDKSFDQKIYIGRVENPFSVYVPIALCNNADFSDMPYAFIRTRISKDEFAEQYPDADMTTYETKGVGEDYWMGQDYLYICEYFEKVNKTKKLYLMSTGETTTDKDLVQALEMGGATIENERDITETKIMWRKITRKEVLEEKEFPGKHIPIVPFLGQEVNINGEKKYNSVIRHAKSAQRSYNYMYNSWIEVMALAPRAPFIAAETQIEGYEDYWKTANSKNHAYLPYHPVTEAGALLPPPQRQPAPEGGRSLLEGIKLANEQLKETTGIYDASLGSRGNETSGTAIIARQKQGDTANFHFVDNQAMSLKHMTRIMIDIIPDIYDTARTIRILGEDMTDKVVEVNAMHPDPTNPKKLYDLTVGNYDVVIDIGPNYESKRTETAENLMNIMKSNPEAAMPIMDLLYRSLDFTYAQEAGDRMKAMIQQQFPGIIAESAGGPAGIGGPGGKPNAQQVQSMVQDMQKLMQAHQMTMQENMQLKQMAQQLQSALQDKTEDQKIKADGQVLKAQTDMYKADAQVQQTVIETAAEHHSNIVGHAVEHNKNQWGGLRVDDKARNSVPGERY